jgi:hypothetical protein
MMLCLFVGKSVITPYLFVGKSVNMGFLIQDTLSDVIVPDIDLRIL